MPATAHVSRPDGRTAPKEVGDVRAEAASNRRGPFRPERLAPVRERISGPALARLFRLVDLVVAIGAAIAVGVFQSDGGLWAKPLGEAAPLLLGPTVTLWALTSLKAYGFGQRESLIRHLITVGAACAAGGLAALFIGLLEPRALTEAAAWTALVLPTLGLAHLWAWRSVKRWRRSGRLTPNIVVVGATPNASRLIARALASREVNVLGIFDDRTKRAPSDLQGVPLLGDTHALLDHKILPYVDRIVITVTSAAQVRVRSLIDRLRVLPNAVTLFVDVEGQDTQASTLSRLADAPLTQVSGVQEDERRAFWKRVQDLVIGSLALLAAAPVMLAVALAVKLDSPGPVLFRQRRHGFNNEAITVYKFRSMRQESADPTARRQVEKNDDRVTRVGRFIRRTSLDELPQLFNVLRGDMSLVGPRPHPIGMLTAGEESQRLVAEYAWRHRMKPGITGWAQINGSRGPVHSRDEVRRRVVLDVEYIERQSFWFDLFIMVMTIPRLLGDKEAVR